MRFDSFMIKHAFNKCSYDCCVYFKEISLGKMICLLLSADDMLITCNDRVKIDMLKKLLGSEFKIKDLEFARRILRMDIVRNRDQMFMFLTQQSYIKKVLLTFGTYGSKPVQTPLVGHFKLSSAQS